MMWWSACWMSEASRDASRVWLCRSDHPFAGALATSGSDPATIGFTYFSKCLL
jgi:hypothetical protein